MTTPYTTGQISLVNGSAMVTGVGTGWATSLIKGGFVFVEVDGGNSLPLLPDDSATTNLHPITDTAMTAAIAWTGPTGTYNYALIRDTAYLQQLTANSQALAEYTQRLNSTALSAVAGITPVADTLLLFTGESTATTIALSGLISGADYDVQVNNLAGRAVYDSRPANYRVLVSDIGDGRSAIYSKNSNTAADWSAPAYVTGAQGSGGPYTEITIGPTTTLPYGSQATVTPTVIDADTIRLDFGIPAGQNGTGTGDFVGPSSSADGELVLFNGTSGKSGKRGPLLSSLGSGQNEAILALEIADLKGSRLGMKGGVADSFDDETGVATKTNATYDETNDWYTGFVETTEESAGTGANGGSWATYTAVDRSYAVDNSKTVYAVWVYSSIAGVGKVKLALETSATSFDIVAEAAMNHPGGGWFRVNLAVPFAVPATGTYRACQYWSSGGQNGSLPSNAVAFKSGDATGAGQTGFTTQAVGFGSRVTYGTGPNNMTLVSVAYPLASVPTTARLTLQTVEFDAVTANTDFIAEFSRDGGTTWTAGNLVLSPYLVAGNYKMYEAQPFSVTSQPSGSSMKWRVRTLNNKNIAISGIVSQGN